MHAATSTPMPWEHNEVGVPDGPEDAAFGPTAQNAQFLTSLMKVERPR